MTFSELLHLISAETHLDLDDTQTSGGCTLRFDTAIEMTLEHQNDLVYMYSPVLQFTQPVADDFFASLMQIHLFGLATNRSWFGYDAGGQRVILFSVMELDQLTADSAVERIEALLDQVQYWQEFLPTLGQVGQPERVALKATDAFQRRKLA